MNETYYYLKGNEVIECKSIEEYVKLADEHGIDNKVAQTTLKIEGEDVTISTVCLMIDHNYLGGSPLIFETMILGGKNDMWVKRYSTYDEALQGHHEIVMQVEEGVEL